jgi:hypothetical protein
MRCSGELAKPGGRNRSNGQKEIRRVINSKRIEGRCNRNWGNRNARRKQIFW